MSAYKSDLIAYGLLGVPVFLIGLSDLIGLLWYSNYLSDIEGAGVFSLSFSEMYIGIRATVFVRNDVGKEKTIAHCIAWFVVVVSVLFVGDDIYSKSINWPATIIRVSIILVMWSLIAQSSNRSEQK